MIWIAMAVVGLLVAGLIGAWGFGLFSGSDSVMSNETGNGSASKQAGSGTSSGTSSASEGTLLRTLTAQQELFELSISPDAQTVASAGDENRLRLWKVSDGSLIREISGFAQRGRCVAFSPDGKVIASGNDDGAVRIWSASDGRLLQTLQGHSKYVFIVGFSPDSQKLVSVGA
jgi:WD40 repeat protein